MADGLRDFVLASTKGLDTLETLRIKQRDQFSKSLVREQRAAIARQQTETANVKLVLDAIKTVQGLPPGQRTAILKETLEGIGVTPSNAALKMFADADIVSSLPMKELEQAADDGTLDTSHVAGVFGSGLNAAKFMGEAARRKTEQARTGKLIIDTQRAKIKLQDAREKAAQDPNEKNRQKFLATRLGRMKVTDEATGESRLATAGEINDMADQVFGPRAEGAATVPSTEEAATLAKGAMDEAGATPKFGTSDLGFPRSSTTTTATTTAPPPAEEAPPGAIPPTKGQPRVLGITRVK